MRQKTDSAIPAKYTPPRMRSTSRLTPSRFTGDSVAQGRRWVSTAPSLPALPRPTLSFARGRRSRYCHSCLPLETGTRQTPPSPPVPTGNSSVQWSSLKRDHQQLPEFPRSEGEQQQQKHDDRLHKRFGNSGGHAPIPPLISSPHRRTSRIIGTMGRTQSGEPPTFPVWLK